MYIYTYIYIYKYIYIYIYKNCIHKLFFFANILHAKRWGRQFVLLCAREILFCGVKKVTGAWKIKKKG